MSPKTVFLLIISLATVCAFAYILTDSDTSDAGTEFSCNGLDYETTSDTEVKVKGFTDETIPALIIPTTVTYDEKTYEVTEIGISAFDLDTELTSVNLGNVSKIGAEAFSGCVSLTTVVGTELSSVGAAAFAGCVMLSDISLGKVMTIGATAFAGCIELRSVSLDKVVSIGNRAFFETGLVSVTLPITTTLIGTAAFNKCPNLLAINVNSIGYVSKDGAVYSRLGNLIIVNQYYILANPNYTIPNAVKSIDEFAFDGCYGIKSINVPDTVTSIKGGAFVNCPSLESVNIMGGESYKTIDSCVYSYDGKTLVFVPETHTGASGRFTIPDSVEIIESYAFSDCSSLTFVDASKVNEVRSYAFSDCSNITTLYLNSDADYSAMSLDLGSMGNVVYADIYSDKSNFLNILDLNLFTNVTYYLPLIFSLENEPEGTVTPSPVYLMDNSVVQIEEYKKLIPAGNIETYVNGVLLESDSFTLKESAAYVKFAYNTEESQVQFECDDELGQFNIPTITVANGTTFTTEENKIIFSNGTIIEVSPKTIEHYTVTFSRFSANSGTVTENMTITAELDKTPMNYAVTVKSNNKDFGNVDLKDSIVLTVTYGTTWSVSNATLKFSDGQEVIANVAKADQQYRYYFKYWDPANGTVETDIVIEAVFMQALQTYEVRVISSDDGIGTIDGQPLRPNEYEYGTPITVDGNIITIGSDTYTAEVVASQDPNTTNTFLRFDGLTETVVSNLEITAVFESIISDIPEGKDVTVETKGSSAVIDAAVIEKIKANADIFTAKTATASLTFDKVAISKMSAATLSVNEVDIGKIPAEAQKAMKVIEIDFGSNHDFSGGKITVRIPMHSDYSDVTVGYVHDGKVDSIKATYDPSNEIVTFEVDHLSTFAVFDGSLFPEKGNTNDGANIAIIAGAIAIAVVFLAIAALVFTGKIPLFKKN